MSRRNVGHDLRQLGSWHAQDRKWVATLAVEPEELERRTRIKFDDSQDDLGRLKYAYLETEPGSEVLLLKYANRHLPGTMVWMPADADSTESRLRDLIDALHLSKSDLLSQLPGPS